MLRDLTRQFSEPLSDVPVAKPLRLKIPTQSDRIMAYVKLEQMRAQERGQVESFEEADDFELDDGETWFSPYEEVFEATDTSDLPPPAGVPPAPIAAEVKPETASQLDVPRSGNVPPSP